MKELMPDVHKTFHHFTGILGFGCKVGPLLVINGVIIPISRVVTPVKPNYFRPFIGVIYTTQFDLYLVTGPTLWWVWLVVSSTLGCVDLHPGISGFLP